MKGSFRKCWKTLIERYGQDGRCKLAIVIMDGDNEYNLVEADRLSSMKNIDDPDDLRVVVEATYSEMREMLKAWQYDLLKEDNDASATANIQTRSLGGGGDSKMDARNAGNGGG